MNTIERLMEICGCCGLCYSDPDDEEFAECRKRMDELWRMNDESY